MNKTKLDETNQQHQVLIGIFGMFVDDFGYSPRELYELIEDSKKKLWHALQEMANERVMGK